eukprot:scaffold297_cov386-Prasinococcus_capsulatus_cf.AAC.7
MDVQGLKIHSEQQLSSRVFSHADFDGTRDHGCKCIGRGRDLLHTAHRPGALLQHERSEPPLQNTHGARETYLKESRKTHSEKSLPNMLASSSPGHSSDPRLPDERRRCRAPWTPVTCACGKPTEMEWQ